MAHDLFGIREDVDFFGLAVFDNFSISLGTDTRPIFSVRRTLGTRL